MGVKDCDRWPEHSFGCRACRANVPSMETLKDRWGTNLFLVGPGLTGGGGGYYNTLCPYTQLPLAPLFTKELQCRELVNCAQPCVAFTSNRAQPCTAEESSRVQPRTHGYNLVFESSLFLPQLRFRLLGSGLEPRTTWIHMLHLGQHIFRMPQLGAKSWDVPREITTRTMLRRCMLLVARAPFNV